jgi:hypothetical protein
VSWQTLDINRSQMPGYLKGEILVWQAENVQSHFCTDSLQ